MKRLTYACERCGLRYEEDTPVISAWFALCPRCMQFNDPVVRQVSGAADSEAKIRP